MAKNTLFDHMRTLSREAILTAVKAAKAGDAELLSLMGLDDGETIANLRALSLESLMMGESFPGAIVDLRFNEDSLNLYIKHVTREGSREQLINEAIRLGIRQQMLEQLTGIGRREFEQRRQVLGAPRLSRGRVKHLSSAREEAVFDAWQALDEHDDVLFKCVAISKRLGIRLDQVWGSIAPLSVQSGRGGVRS